MPRIVVPGSALEAISHKIKAAGAVAQTWLAPGLVGGLFFVVNGWMNERRFIYQADADEGYALMQSHLVGLGHPLYVETFSDHAPGYTYLVLWFTKLFGETPEVARLLTLLLVAAYLSALFALFRRRFPGLAGICGGAVACASLALSDDFIRYSCTAMRGLPSLCFAGLSACLLEHSAGRRWHLVGAGLLLSASLWIKPLTAPLVPAFFVAVVWLTWTRERQITGTFRRLWPMFLAFFATLVIGFLPVVMTRGMTVMLDSHVVETQRVLPGLPSVTNFLNEDAWFVLPALLSAPWLVWRKDGAGAFALLCFVLGSVALCFHFPVWSHHRFLLLMPASALFGLGTARLVSSTLLVQKRSGRWLPAGLLALVVAYSVLSFPPEAARQLIGYFDHRTPSLREFRMQERLHDLAPMAQLMATSEQMLAYRMGLSVPPSLAMTSRKRFKSGGLKPKRLAKLVLESNPDIVVLSNRWPKQARRRIERGMRTSHRRVLRSWKGRMVYIRRSSRREQDSR